MSSTAEPVIRNLAEVDAARVERSEGATIRILLGPEQGTPRFATRCFSLAPGGRIPAHRHAHIEHEQFMLEGEMVLALDGREHTVRTGDCMFIPAGTAHWYENRGQVTARFLCMVPLTDSYETEWLE